jgi:hypothetical protein
MKLDSSSQPDKNVEVFESKNGEYSGLSVEIICRMPHCSLIRYSDREFVVNTEDLGCQRSLRCAA